MIQWLKDHVSVIAFIFGVLSSIVAFIVWLDTEQDKSISQDIVLPIIKDIHDEILVNRQETLTNRQHTAEVDRKVNELEKQSVRMESKVDTVIKMMEKEFNNK